MTRRELIEFINYYKRQAETLCEVLDAVRKELAQTPRAKGQWIEKDGNVFCSECNACWGLPMHFTLEDHKEDHKFCNECGADMRELPKDKVDVYDSTFSLEYQEKAAEEHFADMRESE